MITLIFVKKQKGGEIFIQKGVKNLHLYYVLILFTTKHNIYMPCINSNLSQSTQNPTCNFAKCSQKLCKGIMFLFWVLGFFAFKISTLIPYPRCILFSCIFPFLHFMVGPHILPLSLLIQWQMCNKICIANTFLFLSMISFHKLLFKKGVQ